MNDTTTLLKESHETSETQEESSQTRLGKLVNVFGSILLWGFLLSMAIGSLVAGIWTLVPTEIAGWGASKPNYLGYVSHCSFTPFSSIILFGLVALAIFLIQKQSFDEMIGIGMFTGVSMGIVMGFLNATGRSGINIFIGLGMGVGIGVVFGLLIGLLRLTRG